MSKTAGEYLDNLIVSHNTGWTELENGGRERVIRCWDCGDSDNQDHGHLSISLTAPFLFRCHRCGYSGAVNEDFLAHLGIKIDEKLDKLLKENKRLTKLHAVDKFKSAGKSVNSRVAGTFSVKYRIPRITERELKSPAYKYLCDRFKYQFSIDDLMKFKVILNLKKFGKINMVQKWPEKNEVLDILYHQYIGFQDLNGNDFIFRNIFNDGNPRYYEMKFDKNPFRLYSFATSIPVLTECLKVNVVEGIFDAIGLYLKLGRPQNEVFIAMLGKNIESVIEFFVKMGYLSQNVKIYSDDDVKIKKYRYAIKNMEYPKKLGTINVSVIYNGAGKDTGVEPEKIRFDASRKIL